MHHDQIMEPYHSTYPFRQLVSNYIKLQVPTVPNFFPLPLAQAKNGDKQFSK